MLELAGAVDADPTSQIASYAKVDRRHVPLRGGAATVVPLRKLSIPTYTAGVDEGLDGVGRNGQNYNRTSRRVFD